MVQKVENNWGRWGPEDQLGALNLLTPEVVLDAVRLVRQGKVYSLAVPLERNGPQNPPFHKTWKVTHATLGPGASFLEDVVTMDTHSGTHIDGLSHSWTEGKFYNGYTLDQVFQSGVVKGGIENVSSMVGRGVMLDVPAYRNTDHMGPGEIVTGKELDATAAHQGTEIKQGDIVLIRTGWYQVFHTDRSLWESAVPGPDGKLASWLREKDICALGADQPSVEAKYTDRPDPSSLHVHALRDLGIYLLENLDLESLSRDRVYEFLFVGAPLPLTHASGTPWNPLAIV
ncbi:MAG: cyclase family protein [Chloroflexi bacterium]|nr:cyclase family protein [Chloroflexota bacterium]